MGKSLCNFIGFGEQAPLLQSKKAAGIIRRLLWFMTALQLRVCSIFLPQYKEIRKKMIWSVIIIIRSIFNYSLQGRGITINGNGHRKENAWNMENKVVEINGLLDALLVTMYLFNRCRRNVGKLVSGVQNNKEREYDGAFKNIILKWKAYLID